MVSKRSVIRMASSRSVGSRSSTSTRTFSLRPLTYLSTISSSLMLGISRIVLVKAALYALTELVWRRQASVARYFGGVDRFELFTEESFELLPVGQLILVVGYFLEVVAPPGGCIPSKEVSCQVYHLFVIFDAGSQEVLLHLENPEVDRAFAAVVGFGLFDSDVRRGFRGSAAGSAVSSL